VKTCIAFLVLLVCGSAQAATLTVCPSGCDYANPQAAVDAAKSGDIIEVSGGVFCLPNIIYKGITLKGGIMVAPCTPETLEKTRQEYAQSTASNPSDQAGRLLYSYDFSGSSTSETGASNVEKNGRMHITVPISNYMSYHGPNAQLFVKDFVAQIEATQEGGPNDNAYGLLLRYVDNDNFYRFSISGNGKYRIDKSVNDEYKEIVPWTPSNAIHKGRASNLIKVECKGKKFAFYVNGVKLRDSTDSSFSSGQVLVFANALSLAGVHISFDNLKVWAA